MQTLFDDLNETPQIEFTTAYDLILKKVEHINNIQRSRILYPAMTNIE